LKRSSENLKNGIDTREELPGFIYLLRIYWDLLAVSVFQPTHTIPLPLALILTLTKPSPSLSRGIVSDLFQDL
jgi:hypothetical protein